MKNFFICSILLFPVLGGANVDSPNVMGFSSFFKNRQCADLFLPSKAPKEAASVIPFSIVMPTYLEPKEFFADNQANDQLFYNASGFTAPLSKNDSGYWHPQPYLVDGGEMKILRVRQIPSVWGPHFELYPRKIDELRQNFRLSSYTRVEVPQIFLILYKVMFFVRGMESLISSQHFSSIHLDYRPLVAEEISLKERALQFVASWETRDSQEEAAKIILNQIIEDTYQNHGTFDPQVFTRRLSQEMIFLYPPEFSHSFLEALDFLLASG